MRAFLRPSGPRASGPVGLVARAYPGPGSTRDLAEAARCARIGASSWREDHVGRIAERLGSQVDGVSVNGFVGLLVGAVGGIAASYVVARLRAQAARGLAAQIIADARREAETVRRQADL